MYKMTSSATFYFVVQRSVTRTLFFICSCCLLQFGLGATKQLLQSLIKKSLIIFSLTLKSLTIFSLLVYITSKTINDFNADIHFLECQIQFYLFYDMVEKINSIFGKSLSGPVFSALLGRHTAAITIG